MPRLCPRCGKKYGDTSRRCEACQIWLVLMREPQDPLIGQSIDGRFTITELIAQGGMGSVYRAYQPRVDRHIAVKVLHDHIAADEGSIKRFFREAKAASRLHHHHIVQIYDFCQSSQGLLYMMMEFLDGPLLHDTITRGPIPLARTVGILGQVCDALSMAHGQGIIHRDLKPENIVLLDRAGAPDFVKILDFGIAKMAWEKFGGEGENLTQANNFIGTPHYMSPEQARGLDVDERTDLYALGVLLFEMLVGHPPFDGDTYENLLIRQVREDPPRLAEACQNFVVPPDLDDLCARLLEKQRNKRPASVEEVKTELFSAFDWVPGPGYSATRRTTRKLPVTTPMDELEHRPAHTSVLFHAPRERGQFAEVVVHEVKTPLTVVASGVGLLASGSLGELNPQQKQFLRMIKRNIQRLSHFSTDVLNLSRLNEDTFPINPREMELERVIVSTIRKLHSELKDEESALCIRHEGDDSLRAFADPEAVEAVIFSLVRVLLRSFIQTTDVVIEQRQLSQYFVEVAIRDHGGAEPREGLVAAFRSQSPTADGTMQGLRGIGIRLSVCRALVEKMGGEISVSSTPGEETTFRFTLPLLQAARLTLFGEIARMTGAASEAQIRQAASLQRRIDGRRRRLGEIMIDRGFISRQEVKELLRLQKIHMDRPHLRLPSSMNRGLFGRIALNYTYLAPEQLHRCLALQQAAREEGEDVRLGQVMVDRGLMDPADVLKLISIQQLKLAGCPGCARRYNIPRRGGRLEMHCPECGAKLQGKGRSDDITVVGTLT